MPSKSTVRKAKQQLRRGRSPSTAAGEFVHEEIRHVRAGKHGARSSKQAVAIGLSKARRAGVPLAPPKGGRASERTRRSARRDHATGQGRRKPRASSSPRARATRGALEREGRRGVSRQALSRQGRRGASARKQAPRRRSAKRRDRG